MDTTPPYTAVTHVQGMQMKELPGFYNSTCGPFSPTKCFSQLNLHCVDGRCVCYDTYVPDDSGGCKEDMVKVLVTWMVRLFVSAIVFLMFLTLFHLLVTKRCCKRSGAELEEEDAEDGRSNTCWYDEPPPPYVEVTEEVPPPTYQEAVAKEQESGSGASTRATESATPRIDATAPARRGVETVSAPFPPRPAPPDIHAHQTIHI